MPTTLSVSQTQQTSSSTSGTATTTTGQTIKTRLRSLIDLRYLSTLHFAFRVLIIIFSLAGSIAAGWTYSGNASARFFQFVAAVALIVAFVFIVVYFFKISHRFSTLSWTFIEMLIDAVFAVLFIIASSIITDLARRAYYFESLATAAFFGFAAVLTFIAEGIWNFVQWKRGVTHRSGESITTTTVVRQENYKETTNRQQALY